MAGLTVAGLAAFGYVAAFDPADGGHFPGCPLLALTGWYCPGCGGLRAVHALAHGDAAAALGFNPLLVVLLPVLAVGYGVWAWRAATGRPALVVPGGRWWLAAGLVALLAFWVLRNLPAGAWAAP